MAAWNAALFCQGEAGVVVPDAMRTAERMGCAPEASAELVLAIAAGLNAGARKRKEAADAGGGEAD